MRKMIFLLVGLLLIAGCSGSSPNTPSSIPISIEGVEGATDVAVDSSFVYEFDQAVETSTVTETSFFIVQTPESSSASLVKADLDSDICIPGARLPASLDVESESATLDPTDDLSAGTGYTICLMGGSASSDLSKDIAYADGSTFTSVQFSFTTAGTNSNLSVSSMTKSSNISITAGQGSVDFTFTFSGDASALSPSVAVYDSAGTSMATSCDFQSGSTTVYVCSVSGLAACTTLVDYSANLIGTGINSYSTSFNSADFEGDTTDAYSETAGAACWNLSLNSDGSHPITFAVQEDGTGLLVSSVGGEVDGDDVLMDLIRGLGTLGDFAFSVYYISIQPAAFSGDGESVAALGIVNADFSGIYPTSGKYTSSGTEYFDGWSFQGYVDDEDQYLIPKSSGDFASISSEYYSPIHICLVSKDSLVTSYVSSDDESYTQISVGNMQCSEGTPGCSIPNIVDYNSSGIAENIVISVINNVEGEEMSAKINHVRFKVTDITGVAADCPAF
ncbi:MAG: hypothetical protein HN337_05570 [Deltaproteobacteria bacterium]|nr:hypothetical protein [Deltaproteobacteria bacterium]